MAQSNAVRFIGVGRKSVGGRPARIQAAPCRDRARASRMERRFVSLGTQSLQSSTYENPRNGATSSLLTVVTCRCSRRLHRHEQPDGSAGRASGGNREAGIHGTPGRQLRGHWGKEDGLRNKQEGDRGKGPI